MTNLEYGTKEWFESMFEGIDKRGDKWGHRWRGSQKVRHKQSLKMIKPLLNGESKILDIGCGLGEFTEKLWQENPDNQVIGIDIVEDAIRNAKKEKPNIVFKLGALPELEFADETLDLVIALEVVYYLSKEDRLKAFEDIYRILKRNGHLLFSTVLDNGERYFSEKEARERISEYFQIVDAQYAYRKPYYRLWEDKAIGLLSYLSKIKQLFLIRKILHTLLSFEFPVRISEMIAKIFCGGKCQSHLYILARK